MTVTYTLEPGSKLTEQQIAEVEAAAKMPILYDDDCPELSEDMMKAFRVAVAQRNRLLNQKHA